MPDTLQLEPAGQLDNAALLDASFERAADHGGDITPLVFARFFELAPKAEALFQLDTLDPQARGRMLAEMLTILLDQAGGESYVGPTLATIAADHVAYGVVGQDLYGHWIEALTATVRDLNGPAWTAGMAAAWKCETGKFLAALARKRGR
ncbi:globin [Novosphingobium lentum]|uniref:globin n=1 Tax=Novosphingobium lentum TaxID=145287 RepID=UPI00082ECF0E|nr:globin [Novosphingobium lentum]